MWRLITIDRGDRGVRLDRVLLRHLRDEKGASRNRIQHWIEAGDVLVNGTPPPRPAWRVQPDDEIQIRVHVIPSRAKPAAEPMALAILHEDDDLLAIDKPAGLVVHPAYRNTSGTLMNGLLARARDWPAGSTPALVGRLDKQTSGIVLVTKRTSVYVALQKAMAANRVEKEYLAIVHGKPSPARGTIDLALDRDPWDRRRVTVTDRGGQPSVTKYERIASTGTVSAVRCRLITGRTHQIRVHLSARGWPIVGDTTYATLRLGGVREQALPRSGPAFGRQALHAWRLRFRHPVTGRDLAIEAPVPADMRRLAETEGLTL